MTVKQGEAIKAYKSLLDLNTQKLYSGKLAKQIYDLTQKLKPAYEFQVQEEGKIFSAHPAFDPKLGGINLTGKSDEEKAVLTEELKQIEKEFREMAELDVDLDDYKPFEIDLERNNVQLSGEDIGNLELFIKFV